MLDAVFDGLPGRPKNFRDWLNSEARFTGIFGSLLAMAEDDPLGKCGIHLNQSEIRKITPQSIAIFPFHPGVSRERVHYAILSLSER